MALTRNNCAISGRGRSSSSRIRLTSTRCAGERAGGLPPTRPRFLAASSPSLVLSEIRSRSNWAIEANTWNTGHPAGVSGDRAGMVIDLRARLDTEGEERRRLTALVTVERAPAQSGFFRRLRPDGFNPARRSGNGCYDKPVCKTGVQAKVVTYAQQKGAADRPLL